MRQEKLEHYNNRIHLLLPSVDGAIQTLLLDLIEDIERLSEENNKLRSALLKATQKSKMSSKLKDALME